MRPLAHLVLLGLAVVVAGCGADPPDLTPVHARITEGDAAVVAMKKALTRRDFGEAETRYVEVREKYGAIAAKLEALDLSPEERTPVLTALSAWEGEIAVYRKFRKDVVARARKMGDEPFTVESLKQQGLTEEEARRIQKDVQAYYELDRQAEHQRTWEREEAALDRAMKAVAGLRRQ